MLSWSFAAAILAIAPPTGFTVSVDRLAVSRTTGEASVTVEPLMAQLVLKGLAVTGKSHLCPTVERAGSTIKVHCTSRRIWAELSHDAKGPFIDLRELSGVSWLDETTQIPLRAWTLKGLLLPDFCPGTLAASRGECALDRGDLKTAKAAWIEGLDSPDASLCHLRLGDLASREGKMEEALAHYSKVPGGGPVGRMGKVRLCELMGTCLSIAESDRMADVDNLPPDMTREVRLATIRRELTAGRDTRAMQSMVASIEADPALCEGAITLCQRFLAIGLQSTEPEARVGALSAFLTDKARKGPYEYALNVAASRIATEVGAPAFAAAILSSNTPRVPPGELSSHLLEIINLYLAAKDPVRAAVVLEYAEGKLGVGTRKANWDQARKKIARRQFDRVITAAPSGPRVAVTPVQTFDALATEVALSTDLARAAAARSKAATPAAPVRSTTENAP